MVIKSKKRIDLWRIMCQQICNMLVLVVYCMLYLLVFARCAQVFDQHNQQAEQNEYCTEEAAPSCKAGTHVLCMYDPKKLGPRCLNGTVVPMEHPEQEYIKNIFNGFKRNIANGVEITGKEDEHLPRGQHMMALHWSLHLALEAQAWANQCNPLEHDLCRNYVEQVNDRGEPYAKDITKAGQFVTVFRFNYPDWSYPGQDFADYSAENIPEPTPEKIRFMIKEITKGIYETRKLVTSYNVRNYTKEEKMNTYLLVVYGPSRRFGCAMTKFVDHVVDEKSDNLYNAVMLVCNFSNQPLYYKEVYYYIRPRDANYSRVTDVPWARDKCGCKLGAERNDDCLCNEYDDSTETIPEKPDLPVCHEEEYVDKAGPPAVVLVPIFQAEKADVNNQELKMVKIIWILIDKRSFKRLDDAEEHDQRKHDLLHNINFAVDLERSKVRPLEDTFIPATINPYPLRKASYPKFPTKRKRHTIKPRKDFSNMDQLVSEYLAKKRKFNLQMATDVGSYNDMSKFATATVTPIGLGIASKRNLRYSLRSELNPKNFEYYKNTNKMFQKNIDKARGPDIYNTSNFLRPMKHLRSSGLIHNSGPSYIGHEQSISSLRNKLSKRNQNPLHIHAYRNNFDLNKPIENGYVKYDNLPEMLIVPDNDDGQIPKGDAYPDKISSGDYFRPNRPYVYGTNKIRNIYFGRSKYMRVFKPQ